MKLLNKIKKYSSSGSLIKVGRNKLAMVRIRRRYPEESRKPFWIMVEPTTLCNLRCKFCPRNVPSLKFGSMTFKQFKKIIDTFPNATHFRIQGLGEPFLNKDIFKMIRYAKEKKIIVEIYSNATLVQGKLAKKILNSDIDELMFSVDGATKKTYESLRIGANFEKTMKNIEDFTKLKKLSRSKMKVKLAVVLMKENYKELANLVDLAYHLGVDGIGVQLVQYKFDIGISNKKQAEAFEKYQNDLKKRIDVAFNYAKELGLEITVPTFEYNDKICEWAWSGIYITWNGNILPCCSIFDRVMGNIFTDNFDDVWNNENYKKFRRNISGKGESIPKECVGCTFFMKTKTWIP